MTHLCNGRSEEDRYYLRTIEGDCLEGAGLFIPHKGYAIIDHNAEIRVGDLVHCSGKIAGGISSYIKQVKGINGDSVVVGTCYLDNSKDYTFEPEEIIGVVKEVYCRMSGDRVYVRSECEYEEQEV